MQLEIIHRNNGHKCAYKVPAEIWGSAVNLCVEDEGGKYWITNTEYASQINYCPFCGSRSPTQITEEEFINEEIREDLCI